MVYSSYLPYAYCKEFNIPEYVCEYKFHPSRKWRIDIAFPEIKLAVEIEGGLWGNGRHNRPASMIKDMEKYNMLTELGWGLLRYTPQTIDFEQISKLANALKQ